MTSKRHAGFCRNALGYQQDKKQPCMHAMQKLYENQSVEGLLLVAAKNAFNGMNREALKASGW